MLFGHCEIANEAIHTHNDTYSLRDFSAVSARRPFLAPCMICAGLLAGFGGVFADLLFTHEFLLLGATSGGLALIGLQLAQLQLLSRDLKGAELSNVILGSYDHINRLRREIGGQIVSREARHD